MIFVLWEYNRLIVGCQLNMTAAANSRRKHEQLGGSGGFRHLAYQLTRDDYYRYRCLFADRLVYSSSQPESTRGSS